MKWIFVTFLLLVIQNVVPYNVDQMPLKTLTNPAALFGYRVLQIDTHRLLVSAPLVKYNEDKRGKVYGCTIQDSSCSEVNVQVPVHGKMMSLGLSMAKDPQSPKSVVCGPTIPRTCETITTYNGMCFQLDENLRLASPGQPTQLKDCPGGTDIVFVIDGSGSIQQNDFEKMKSFIKSLIQQFISGNTQFSIMQYSHQFQIHFTFTEFNRGRRIWESLIDNIRQIGGWTHTPTAIIKAVQELFVPSSGARPNANKVLVVITDGVTFGDNTPMRDAVAVADRNNVIRYAIGVGAAFRTPRALQELETIASIPIEKHRFQVENFQALDNIKDALQKSIFAIEGSQTSGQSLQMELAQEGFSSALLSSGAILMGTVGAYDWRGGYQHILSGAPTFYNITAIESNSYLGYSMAVAKRDRKEIVILGAPRHQHEGIVVINIDNRISTIKSKQIGSYFGAEVCTVDLDSDSNTDLLLISAPSYTNPTRDSEGEVTVCSFLRKESIDQSCNSVTLVGDAGMRGRFGASISALADLNGDKISEVAVGAPMENNGKGSVYIFCGVTGGINPAYCQKIMGSSTDSGLQYFGQSISGSLDQTGDGLPDIAVGSNGKVLFFRSRPVLFVRVTVSYNPTKIPTNNRDCSVERSHNGNICFHATRRTRDTGGFTAQINYTLTLDSTRSATRTRAYFSDKSQSHTNTVTIDTNVICVQQQFLIPSCPEDALNPLHNGLRFSFDGLSSDRSRLAPVLDPSSQENTNHPLDFEMNCGADSKCIDDLRVDFNFSGVSEVQVGIALELNVTISVENRGEDSYNSHVIFTYPAGLSYRRVTLLQNSNKRNTVQCTAEDSVTADTVGISECYINRPIFQSQGQIFFVLNLGIDGNSQFDRMVKIKANATSGNEQHSLLENVKTKTIPVKYNIYFVLRSFEGSTTFINFTAGESLKKPVQHAFEVINYLRNLNVTVTIRVPVRLGDEDLWADNSSIQIKGCQNLKDELPVGKNFIEKLKKTSQLDCSVSVCRTIKCHMHLRKGVTNIYNISGEVRSEWMKKTQLSSLHLVSSSVVDYDESQYIFTSSSAQNPTYVEAATRVEVYTKPDFTKEIAWGIVGGLLLLALVAAGLYKAGFFKSKYNKMVQEAGEGGDGGTDGSADATPTLG